MKFRFVFVGLLSLLAVSCSFNEIALPEDNFHYSGDDVFYATVDELPDVETKVYADDKLRILWNEDDRITIFNKNTYNQQYRFTGASGDNAGGFRIVKSDDEFVTSNPLDLIYAVYPYLETTKISNDGIITSSIPSEQSFKDGSFGIGANTMVSVAESNMLKFKNVGGYLSLKFYGEGVSVSSITLKSNNGELIAGQCDIALSNDYPEATMVSGKATDGITMTCEPPVELGPTSSEAVTFIFVLPPVTLSEGFTVTITTSDGATIEKSSVNERIIKRSAITRLGAIMITPNNNGGEPLGTVGEAIDLGLSVKWASWNVGASKIDDYGGLFGAGDGTGSLSTTNYNDYYYNEGESICGTEHDLAHNLWGGRWRMPTREELDELFNSCSLEEATVNGVVGVYATGPNGASIFLPYSGNRQGTYVYERGTHGHYWSGDTYSNVHSYGYYDVDILDGSVEQREGCENWIGQSIRPVYAPPVPELIDLGLPSGIKWASFNVGASKSEEYGFYYAWGELKPKDDYSWQTYKWCEGDSGILTKYNSTGSYGTVDNKTALNPEDDVATVLFGGEWRMPTFDDFQELKTLCSWEYIKRDGHNGYLVTGPNGNSIFMPCTGNSVGYAEFYGCYWGADVGATTDQNACNLDFTSGFIDLDDDLRCLGRCIRAVNGPRTNGNQVPVPEAIDLGLSVKWASFNVGASSPEGTGDFFAWGEITPRTEVPSGAYAWTVYKWCNGEYAHMLKYNTNPSYGDVDGLTVLEKGDDAAASSLHGFWRMPTAEEQNELMQSCTWNWTSRGGVYGYEVTSKINGNSIFLPAAGYKGDDSTINEVGEVGLYWSSSLTRRSVVYTAYRLRFANGEIDQMDINRSFALQVRPVWEELTIPEAVDLGLSVKWASMNLGAISPESVGHFYAWGEVVPKSSYDWSSYKWCDGTSDSVTKYGASGEDGVFILDSYDDVVRNKLGEGWRMPTLDDWHELLESCTWTWTNQNGVDGYRVSSSSNNNSIFFPVTGYKGDNLWVNSIYSSHFWASTYDEGYPEGANILEFDSGGAILNNHFRKDGLQIRPIHQ